MTEEEHAAALAQLLRRLPPPARLEWAKELVELGVRVHPDLATKRLVREGPEWMGNHAPQRIAPIDVPDDELMGHLQRLAPGVASDIQRGRDDVAQLEMLRDKYGKLLPPDIKAKIDAYARQRGAN